MARSPPPSAAMSNRYRFMPFVLALALCACQHAPASTVATPQVLLLGEVHDSADGHAARLAVLKERIEAGWRPTIAMEQFDLEFQAGLDAAMRDCQDADCVIAKATPPKSSWHWDYYKPVITLALEFKLPVVAANLSRTQAAKIVRGDFGDALPPALIAEYRLDALPADVLAAQAQEVRDSHCGALPEAMVTPMAKSQIARDVVMAETLRAHAAGGVVLIAGNGHVRGDIAVPYWLRRDGLNPQTVGFLEPTGDARPYDQVRRIPQTQRPDPCAGFKPPGGGR